MYLATVGDDALLKVGTSDRSRILAPLEGLELVDEADETDRHRRFRADARRRGDLDF